MSTLRMRGEFHLICLLLVVAACASGLLCTTGKAWAAGGDLLWEAPTGGALAVSNGRVVVAGSAGVQTFDGDTGTLVWQDSFFGATTVSMDAHRVIAVGANAIRAYDSRTGFLDWQGPLASGTVVRAAVLEKNQFLVTGSTIGTTGDVQLLTRAYNAKTGAIQWEDLSVPAGKRLALGYAPTHRAISVHGTRAYIVANLEPFPVACLVRAYDRTNGNLVWESVSQDTCRANAVAAHKRQVILAAVGGSSPDDFMVRAFDTQSGSFLWENRTLVSTGFDNQAVSVDDEGKRAFVAGWVLWLPGRLNQEAFLVRAYNMATGELYWEDQYPGSGGPCLCHARDIVAEHGRVFAVGVMPFIVRAYDARSGNLLWQNELPTGRAASVALDRGVVFAADSGVLRAYDAK